MKRTTISLFAGALFVWTLTMAGAVSAQTSTGTADDAAGEGRPHDYESPICREARARAEAAADVPGFTKQLEQITSTLPECFVGWEPGGG